MKSIILEAHRRSLWQVLGIYLNDAKGDSETAALHYARFVELWKDADAELQPRVAAARARLNEIVRARG